MQQSHLSKALITLAFGLPQFPANAEFLDIGNATLDTTTNLEWLDLTQTTALSVTQVTQMLSVGQSLSGYRYATSPETTNLLVGLGLPLISSQYIAGQYSYYGRVEAATSYLGNTHLGTNYTGFAGITGDAPPRYPEERVVLFAYRSNDNFGKYLNTFAITNSIRLDQYELSIGHYLVKEHLQPVPELSTMWLLLLGLPLSVLGAHKRYKVIHNCRTNTLSCGDA